MATKDSAKLLRDELSVYCRNLLLIKKRLYLLRAIENRLAKNVGPNGWVKITNWHVSDMVNDTYSMLVIDLCSFCTNFAEKGGFIRHLNNYVTTFRPSKAEKIVVGKARILSTFQITPERIAEIQVQSQIEQQQRLVISSRKALGTLFPKWEVKGKVDEDDIEELRIKFMEAVKHVDVDRNVHKAHRFEKDSVNRAKTIAPLALADIEKAFATVEVLLGRLWMISDLASYGFDTDLGMSTDQTANDLVDLMIHGTDRQ